MRRLARIIAVCAAFAALPAKAQPVRVVEATGIAFSASAADRESARRRALGDALVAAAMAGGAQISGRSALLNGRITTDMTLVQFAGRVLAHQVLSVHEQGQQWQVRIRAEVGPPPAAGPCGTGRRLTISALPPQIAVRPDVPAWAEPLAGQLALDLAGLLQTHPATQLDGTAPERRLSAPAALDYTSLMEGRSAPAAGNHRLAQAITVQRSGQQIHLVLDLALAGHDGETITRRFTRSASLPQAGLAGLVGGASRDRAAQDLTAGLLAEVAATLDALGCQAPQARITLAAEGLQVPLGAVHGLTRGALGLVALGGGTLDLLEITQLGARHAILRPLDPTRPASAFAGQPVHFVEAGL